MKVNWFIKEEDIIKDGELFLNSTYELQMNKCPTVPEGIPVPLLDSEGNEIGSCEILIDKLTKLKKVKIISLYK